MHSGRSQTEDEGKDVEISLDIIEEEKSVQEGEERQARRREFYETGMEIDFYQAALFYATSEQIARGQSIFKLLAESRLGSQALLKTEHHKKLNVWYTRYRMLIVVTGLFFLQLMLLFWLNLSIVARSCYSSEECGRGSACIQEPVLNSRKFRSACRACEELDDTVLMQNATGLTRWVEETCFEISDNYKLMQSYNQNEEPNIKLSYKYSRSRTYSPSVFVQLCIGCVDQSFQYRTLRQVIRRGFLVMRTGDYLALATCALAVTLALVRELRETKILELAQRHALRRRDSLNTSENFWKFKRSHLWFALLVDLRQYLLVPGVLAAIARLVAVTGTDGVSIVFNVVAVVFVVELDNLLSELLSENTRKAIKRANGQLRLSPAEMKYVSIHQRVYIALLPIAVILALCAEAWLSPDDSQSTPPSTFVAALPVLLVSTIEVILFKDRPIVPNLMIACLFPKFCCRAKKRHLANYGETYELPSARADSETKTSNTSRTSSSLINQQAFTGPTSSTAAAFSSLWNNCFCGAESDVTITLLPWRNPLQEPGACLFDLALHMSEYLLFSAIAAGIVDLVLSR